MKQILIAVACGAMLFALAFGRAQAATNSPAGNGTITAAVYHPQSDGAKVQLARWGGWGGGWGGWGGGWGGYGWGGRGWGGSYGWGGGWGYPSYSYYGGYYPSYGYSSSYPYSYGYSYPYSTGYGSYGCGCGC